METATEQPRWLTEGKDRIAAAGDLIKVGSDLHLLEMAIDAYEKAQACNSSPVKAGDSDSRTVVRITTYTGTLAEMAEVIGTSSTWNFQRAGVVGTVETLSDTAGIVAPRPAKHPAPLPIPCPEVGQCIPVRLRGWATYRMESNPCEVIAAKHWAKANEREFSGIFDYLCGDGNRPGNPSERDWAVANSLMQWLGSPIGRRGFLRDMLAEFAAAEKSALNSSTSSMSDPHKRRLLTEALTKENRTAGDLRLGSWDCPTSPSGECAYDADEDSCLDSCLFCNQPDERK